MDNLQLARIVGFISLLLAFIIKGIILARQKWWLRYGRAAGVWMLLYIYFLIILRGVSLFNWATRDQLTIISGYAGIIPLVGIVLHILIRGREDKI
jgi:hypothetical protein